MTSSTAIAQTVLRASVGSVLFAHGAQKLFGLFGGHGIAGTAGFFDSIGIKPAKQTAIAAGLSEAGGGVALALGLATPVGAAAAATAMGVAAAQHRDNGFFATEGGYEYPAVLGVVAASLLISGSGPLSLDRLLGGALDRPWMRLVAGAVIVPSIAVVLTRQAREKSAPVLDLDTDA